MGYCKRCGAPLLWNLEVDSNGYKVKSLRCWNGHYKDLIILNLSPVANDFMQKVRFIPYKCPQCGGNFNFVQRVPSFNGEPIPVHGVCRTCNKEYTITVYVRNGANAGHKAKKEKAEGQPRRRENSSLS